MPILGGRKVTTKLPVIGLECLRLPFSVVLNGTTWVTVVTVTEYIRLHEILVKIPSLSGTGGTITLALFDSDYVVNGEERWNSGARMESTIQDIELDWICPTGTLLKIKRNAAGTETVTGIMYGCV